MVISRNMNINDILPPHRIQQELKALQQTQIPPTLQAWIEPYRNVSKRSDYLWLWAYRSVQLVTLPSTPHEYRQSLYETKCLMVMFITLLDDIADSMRNRRMLSEILNTSFFGEEDISSDNLNSEETNYLRFAAELRRTIAKSITEYPKYEEYMDVFEFDFRQILDAIHYGFIINQRPYLINQEESWLYLPHNFSILISFTMDLMCDLGLDIEEYRRVRRVGWELQKMGQATNWITTWEREVSERDFTSVVFAYAMKENIIQLDDLYKGTESEIAAKIKSSRIEERVWEDHSSSYRRVMEIVGEDKTGHLKRLIPNIEKLTTLQLISRGKY